MYDPFEQYETKPAIIVSPAPEIVFVPEVPNLIFGIDERYIIGFLIGLIFAIIMSDIL